MKKKLKGIISYLDNIKLFKQNEELMKQNIKSSTFGYKLDNSFLYNYNANPGPGSYNITNNSINKQINAKKYQIIKSERIIKKIQNESSFVYYPESSFKNGRQILLPTITKTSREYNILNNKYMSKTKNQSNEQIIQNEKNLKDGLNQNSSQFNASKSFLNKSKGYTFTSRPKLDKLLKISDNFPGPTKYNIKDSFNLEENNSNKKKNFKKHLNWVKIQNFKSFREFRIQNFDIPSLQLGQYDISNSTQTIKQSPNYSFGKKLNNSQQQNFFLETKINQLKKKQQNKQKILSLKSKTTKFINSFKQKQQLKQKYQQVHKNSYDFMCKSKLDYQKSSYKRIPGPGYYEFKEDIVMTRPKAFKFSLSKRKFSYLEINKNLITKYEKIDEETQEMMKKQKQQQQNQQKQFTNIQDNDFNNKQGQNKLTQQQNDDNLNQIKASIGLKLLNLSAKNQKKTQLIDILSKMRQKNRILLQQQKRKMLRMFYNIQLDEQVSDVVIDDMIESKFNSNKGKVSFEEIEKNRVQEEIFREQVKKEINENIKNISFYKEAKQKLFIQDAYGITNLLKIQEENQQKAIEIELKEKEAFIGKLAKLKQSIEQGEKNQQF